MRARLGWVTVSLVIGLVLGGGAAFVTRDDTGSAAGAAPGSKGSQSGSESSDGSDSTALPSPTLTSTPSPDIDYPALTAADVDSMTFRQRRTSDEAPQAWFYPQPQGWRAFTTGEGGEAADVLVPSNEVDARSEVRFRPPGEPVAGGYSLRMSVLPDGEGFQPSTMVTNRLQLLRSAPGEFLDLNVLRQEDDALLFAYVAPDSRTLRYNFFRWFVAPGQSLATLEMSVTGRERDLDGLLALFDEFASRTQPAS